MSGKVFTSAEALKQAAINAAAGNFDYAEQLCRAVLTHSPDDTEAARILARTAALRQAEAEAAVAAAEPVAQSDLQELKALFDGKKFAEGETLARRLLARHPRHYVLNNLLGTAFVRQEKLDEAVASYRRCVDLFPEKADAQNNLGSAYFQQRKYDEALPFFEAAVALNPQHSRAYFNLAVTRRKLGNSAGAAQAFIKSIEADPDNLKSHSALSQVLTETGDVATANTWAETHGLPMMRRLAARASLTDMTDMLASYYNLLKVQDTEEQYARYCLPAMHLLYDAVNATDALKPGTPFVLQVAAGAPRKVAFFAETLTELAHTRNLFNYTRSLAARKDLGIEPVIYYSSCSAAEILDQYRDAGIETVALSQAGAIEDKCLWMRRHLYDHKIDVCVILGTLSGLFAFLLAARVAPVQIWWSQKYHGLDYATIDGYLTLGGFEPFREVQGRIWRCIPGLFGTEITAPADADGMALARSIRAELLEERFTKIAGVIGREEKIDNDAYWDCIAAVMNKHPDLLFIWSGQRERASILARIAARSLTDRCRYVGWVQTKVYANVVDFYLDSFPFPGGHTLIEAIMADKPAVSLVTKEGRRIGIPIFAEPWLKNDGGATLRQLGFEAIFTGADGEDLLPFVQDEKTYVTRALALIESPALQTRWTTASRAFVEQYLTDMNRPAEMLNRHIQDVIRDREPHLRGS